MNQPQSTRRDGTETILIAMYKLPEWCRDMFDTCLDCCKILDAGYCFDAVYRPDAIGITIIA